MQYISIRAGNKLLARKVKVCDTHQSKTIGLMFHPALTRSEGIILVANKQSTTQTSIHSFFVFFTFDALWIDEKKKVVDKRTVNPFTILLRPRSPAKYVLELSKGSTQGIQLGTILEF